GGVVGERMAARLSLQEQGKGRIARDIDPLDRIHLHRDGEPHAALPEKASRKPVVNTLWPLSKAGDPPDGRKAAGSECSTCRSCPLPPSCTRSLRCWRPPPWRWPASPSSTRCAMRRSPARSRPSTRGRSTSSEWTG